MSDFSALDASMSSDTVEEEPWVKDFMSNLITKSQTESLKWCKEVASIGLNVEDVKKSYCSVYLDKVQELFDDLAADIRTITSKYLDSIQERLQTIDQLCRLLQIEMPCYDNEGKTMYQLHQYLTTEMKYYQKLVNERRETLQMLQKQQEELCKALGRPRKQIQCDPLPNDSELQSFKMHVEKLNQLKAERLERFQQLKYEICEIVTELQPSPTLDFERKILQMSPDDIYITDSDMLNLDNYLKRLKSDFERVKEHICELQLRIEVLWNALEIDLTERSSFLKKLTGNNYQTQELLKQELSRCESLKKENIKLFIDKLRQQLVTTWQQCHLDVAPQKEAFFAFSCDLYNEDQLELH